MTCLLCKCRYKSNKELKTHLRYGHDITLEDYFIKFFIEEKVIIFNPFCVCGNKKKFVSLEKGFKHFCSERCRKNRLMMHALDSNLVEKNFTKVTVEGKSYIKSRVKIFPVKKLEENFVNTLIMHNIESKRVDNHTIKKIFIYKDLAGKKRKWEARYVIADRNNSCEIYSANEFKNNKYKILNRIKQLNKSGLKVRVFIYKRKGDLIPIKKLIFNKKSYNIKNTIKKP